MNTTRIHSKILADLKAHPIPHTFLELMLPGKAPYIKRYRLVMQILSRKIHFMPSAIHDRTLNGVQEVVNIIIRLSFETDEKI